MTDPHSMGLISNLLTEPSFQDGLESRYCLIHVDRREQALAHAWYSLGTLYWLGCVALTWPVECDAATTRILVPSALVMASLTALGFFFIKSTRLLRVGQLAGFVLSSLVMMAVTRADLMDGVGNRAVAGMWIFGATTGLGLLAYRNYVHIGAIVVFLGALAYGLSGYPEPITGWCFGALLALVSSNAQIFAHRAFKREAILSFRAQAICTPKQVLMHAIETQKSISEVFGPEDRVCVCICSDWRNFQSFSADVGARQLADILSAYYTEQQKLLAAAFPEGNYFLDWIADELFAVAFITPKSDELTLASGALHYARSSLKTRQTFHAKHGAPAGVDIGIALGTATVGMLGPEGNKKATALGNVAGTARRLQSVGKALRAAGAVVDRAVFHPSMAAYLPDAHDLETVAMPPGLSVKDLALTSVLALRQESMSNAPEVDRLSPVPLVELRRIS